VPEALQTYVRAIHLAPTRAVNHVAIARLLWRSGQATPALEWSEKASELEPNYWEATLWRARALSTLGRQKEAIFTLKDLMQRYRENQKTVVTPPQSPYEASILHYEETVIRADLARLRSADVNGVQ